MSLGEARLDAGEKRKKGTAIRPKREVKMSRLRERLTWGTLSGVDLMGKRMALVGQTALQVKQ